MKEIKNEEFPSEQGSFLFRLQRHTLITSGRNGRGKVQISQDRKSTKEKRDEKGRRRDGEEEHSCHSQARPQCKAETKGLQKCTTRCVPGSARAPYRRREAEQNSVNNWYLKYSDIDAVVG